MPATESVGPTTTLVVPCHNEADRLDVATFASFITANPNMRLVFVDDGSRDGTRAVLDSVQAVAGERVGVVSLPQNRGKAEAVRQGLQRAIADGADFVGFWDADLATPLDAVASFIELLSSRPALEIVMGSRVLLLGRSIDRRPVRHYAGRVFATAASAVLELPVYDTQCGAKMFRVSPRLERVLEQPFLSTWVFDVEIIARYGSLTPPYTPGPLRDCIYELPLLQWRDVEGSKVKWIDFVKAMVDLARIRNTYIGFSRAAAVR